MPFVDPVLRWIAVNVLDMAWDVLWDVLCRSEKKEEKKEG